VKIIDIRIVELMGTIDDPEVYWEQRSVHPADDYQELRVAGLRSNVELVRVLREAVE
jgi:hypothetical protein